MQKDLDALLMLSLYKNEWSYNEKKEFILKNYSSKFEYLLQLSFDPLINIGLNNLTSIKDPPYLVTYDIFENFKELVFLRLQSRITPNQSRELLYELVNCNDYSLDHKKTLVDILTKKIDIGVEPETINKILNKEIISCPSFMSPLENIEEILKWDSIIYEELLYGIRMIAYVSGTYVKFFTDKFKEISSPLLENIKRECSLTIEKSGLKGNWFFDGTLTSNDTKSTELEIYNIINGNNDGSLFFNIFDMDEGDTLKKGSGIVPFSIRRETLNSVFLFNKNDYITLADTFFTDDKKYAYMKHNKVGREYYKGIIAKNPDHVYECQKSSGWVKIN